MRLTPVCSECKKGSVPCGRPLNKLWKIQRPAHGETEHMHMHMPSHMAIACSVFLIAPNLLLK